MSNRADKLTVLHYGATAHSLNYSARFIQNALVAYFNYVISVIFIVGVHFYNAYFILFAFVSVERGIDISLTHSRFVYASLLYLGKRGNVELGRQIAENSALSVCLYRSEHTGIVKEALQLSRIAPQTALHVVYRATVKATAVYFYDIAVFNRNGVPQRTEFIVGFIDIRNRSNTVDCVLNKQTELSFTRLSVNNGL